jgi:Family of unknown function (DUF6093)
MSLATDTLAFFRGQWADRFTDSCVVKRTATSVLNQTTGVYEPTFTTNYSGPCLVRPMAPADEEAGQELVATRGYSVFLPYTEDDQLPGDLVDITSATDTFLTGKQFVVRNIPGDTYVTRRELICEEVVG